MKFLCIFLLATHPAFAGDNRLYLVGTVPPVLEIGIQPFNDGYALRNLGNSLTLFQIGSQDKSGRQVSWLRQSEQVLLRTDYLLKTGEVPLEIRILAP